METTRLIRIAVRTRNESLGDRLRQLLSHWAESACVLAAPARDTNRADIRFWDVDTCPVDSGGPPPASAPSLVVITDDEKRAIAAYQHHPDAFLTSRLTAADLRAAMARCYHAWQDGLIWLSLSGGRDLNRLPMGGIHYIEASGRESVIHYENTAFTVPVPLGALAEQLPSPPFFRCQRSFVVHLSDVRPTPEGGLVTVKEQRLITVSRKYLEPFREALLRWNALEAT